MQVRGLSVWTCLPYGNPLLLRAALRATAGAGFGASNSQDLWIGVSCDLLIISYVVGSFDELALLEPGAGADEGD